MMESEKENLVNELIKSWQEPGSSVSERSLVDIARDKFYTKGDLDIMFPFGLSDVISSISEKWIAQTEQEADLRDSFNSMSFSQKVSFLMKKHIEIAAEYRNLIPNILNFLQKPQSLLLKGKLWTKGSDFIITKAGDKSIDFNYYTKRGIMMYVYGTSLMHWVNTKDIESAQQFVDNQLSHVKKIGIVKECFQGIKGLVGNLDIIKSMKQWNKR